MERKDTIQNAYRLTGSNNFYDGMCMRSLPSESVDQTSGFDACPYTVL